MHEAPTENHLGELGSLYKYYYYLLLLIPVCYFSKRPIEEKAMSP